MIRPQKGLIGSFLHVAVCWSKGALPIEDLRLQIADFSEELDVENLGQNLKSTILNLKSFEL